MQQNKGQQSKSPDQILQSITKDRWNFLDDIDLTRQAEEAAGKDNVKEPVMSSEEHWKVLQRSQTDLARLSEPQRDARRPRGTLNMVGRALQGAAQQTSAK